jgi:hypothetical protein
MADETSVLSLSSCGCLLGFRLRLRTLNDPVFRLTESIFFTQDYFYVIET